MKARMNVPTTDVKRAMHARVGIGLRSPHLDDLLGADAPLSWVEIHSENWMTDTGPIPERLMDVRRKFDVSLHGVGMSLGSASGIDSGHLARLRRLVDRCDPILVSEHLSWGRIGKSHSNDLLPMPYDMACVRLFADRIDQVQQVLGRELLVENVSSYCTFAASVMPEWEFVSDIVERAGCGLLLDLNNVFVNAHNHVFDPARYLDAMPWGRIREVHLAGYDEWDGVLIDTHGRPVQAGVWDLFAKSLSRLPTQARVLIEWDTDLPALGVLLEDAAKAVAFLSAHEVAHA